MRFPGLWRKSAWRERSRIRQESRRLPRSPETLSGDGDGTSATFLSSHDFRRRMRWHPTGPPRRQRSGRAPRSLGGRSCELRKPPHAAARPVSSRASSSLSPADRARSSTECLAALPRSDAVSVSVFKVVKIASHRNAGARWPPSRAGRKRWQSNPAARRLCKNCTSLGYVCTWQSARLNVP
jgi:hypothetical protein